MGTAVDSAAGLEVHVGRGLPGFGMVGVRTDTCEAWRDAVRTEFVGLGGEWPMLRITVSVRGRADQVAATPSADDRRTLAVLIAQAAGVPLPPHPFKPGDLVVHLDRSDDESPTPGTVLEAYYVSDAKAGALGGPCVRALFTWGEVSCQAAALERYDG